MERIRCPNPKCGRHILDIEQMPPGRTVLEMLRVEKEGYPIVMHCHDEIIAEVPEGTGSVDEMCEIMAVQPEWAEGLPLRADGYECSFYQKQ